MRKLIIPLITGILALLWLGGSVYGVLGPLRAAKVVVPVLYVAGQEHYTPGGEAKLRVLVRDVATRSPLPQTHVVIGLRPATETIPLPLYEGTTDAVGQVEARLTIPENADPQSVLVVQAFPPEGEIRVEQPVTIYPALHLLINTDRVRYQPGQTLHLRVLAFDPLTLKPVVMAPVDVTLADARGNRVFQRLLLTSPNGVIVADIPLAGRVLTGAWTITATSGAATAQATVTITSEARTSFRVALTPGQPYARPGATVRGTVKAWQTFGKPVVGTVDLSGFAQDGQAEPLAHITGQTDAQGAYTFEIPLPDPFPGLSAQHPVTFLTLEARVQDEAGHSERVQARLPIAAQDLLLDAVPESGNLVPGVENIVYLRATTPDGRPVATGLTVTTADQSATLTTDADGLAEWRLVSNSTTVPLTLTVSEGGTRLITLTAASQALLVRPERLSYTAGETLALEVYAPWETGTIYLDYIRAGQIVGTGVADLKDGRASATLNLDPAWNGPLAIRAYALSPAGVLYRDTRLVRVRPAHPLQVTITPDLPVYTPGATARLILTVSDDTGGVPALLGLVGLDEAAPDFPGFVGFSPLDPAPFDPSPVTLAYAGAGGFTRDTLAEAQTRLQALLRDQRERWLAAEKLTLTVLLFFLALGSLVLALDGLKLERRSLVALLGCSIAAAFLWGLMKELTPHLVLMVIAAIALLAWIALLGLTLMQRDFRRSLGLGFIAVYLGATGMVLVIAHALTGSLRIVMGLMLALGLAPLALACLGWAGAGAQPRAWWTRGAWFVLATVLIFALFLFAPGRPAGTSPEPSQPMPFPSESPAAEAGIPTLPSPPPLEHNPGTLWFWIPELLTDEQGQATLTLPLPDTITTWQLTALAYTWDGRVARATTFLPVSQDIAVSLDITPTLTTGQEAILLVSVANYLDTAQELDLVLEQQGWFKALDGLERTITVPPHDVVVVHFRLSITAVQGSYLPMVWAYGESIDVMATTDREIRIQPQGTRRELSWIHYLEAGSVFTQDIAIPEDAVWGTARLDIKAYPDNLSYLVETAANAAPTPDASFEQVSGAMQAWLLVLQAGSDRPELRAQAERAIALAYQHLLTFESADGGFVSGDLFWTADALMVLADMAQVYPVDSALIARTADWLLQNQEPEGNWDGPISGNAFITWALIRAGYGDRPEVVAALRYLRDRAGTVEEPYTLALIANALIAAEPQEATTLQVLERLATMALEGEGGNLWWETPLATLTGARDEAATQETTALVVHALAQTGTYADQSERAIRYLLTHKAMGGIWAATLLGRDLALVPSAIRSEQATIGVRWNTLDQGTVTIGPETEGSVKTLALIDLGNGLGRLILTTEGTGQVLVQITASWYQP